MPPSFRGTEAHPVTARIRGRAKHTDLKADVDGDPTSRRHDSMDGLLRTPSDLRRGYSGVTVRSKDCSSITDRLNRRGRRGRLPPSARQGTGHGKTQRARYRLSELDRDLSSGCPAFEADLTAMVCDDLFHQAQAKACASAFGRNAIEGFENQLLMLDRYT